jgi:hypothetical protein
VAEPLILYSTNTSLAYSISKEYYGDKHFVWCTPYFDHAPTHGRSYTVPPSSSPAEIYRTYTRDIEARDNHSDKINGNRLGLLRGAKVMREMGIITGSQSREIAEIVKLAEFGDFRPLIYVIPYALTKRLIRRVPPYERAHPLSAEYIIRSLPGNRFDTIML